MYGYGVILLDLPPAFLVGEVFPTAAAAEAYITEYCANREAAVVKLIDLDA